MNFVVLMYAVVLCVMWHGIPDVVVQVTKIIDLVFVGIFALEAIIKIAAMKGSYFKDNWNRFDFAIIVAILFTLIVGDLMGVKFVQ